MSEIQSIAQNNYILHNIDAKKLYVQEPLFTANSGDAVYVGWRPDETVLWENTTPITTTGQKFVLSEHYSAFDHLNFVMRMDQGMQDIPVKSVDGYFSVPFNYVKDGVAVYETQTLIQFTGTSGSILTTKCLGWNVGSTAKQPDTVVNNWEWTTRALTKIVGINRKENV